MTSTGAGGDPTDAGHPSATELAERDEGLLDPERSAVLDAHVAGCSRCAQARAAVRDVGRRLATVPAPPMPAAVAARLDAVLTGEVDRRERRQALRVVSGGGWSRTTLGRFGEDRPRRSLRQVLGPALAAAVAAAVVGFGAYVVSARAGLNEPPVVAAVTSQSLGAQAGALERQQDLDPHRFSRAWQCARQVTDGRIVALASSTVDGTPALLVFLRSGATTRVTVVTGCDSGRPHVETSDEVSRR